VCNGGILKAIGWKDIDAPMVLAIGKGTNGHYMVSHLQSVDSDLEEDQESKKSMDL